MVCIVPGTWPESSALLPPDAEIVALDDQKNMKAPPVAEIDKLQSLLQSGDILARSLDVEQQYVIARRLKGALQIAREILEKLQVALSDPSVSFSGIAVNNIASAIVQELVNLIGEGQCLIASSNDGI